MEAYLPILFLRGILSVSPFSVIFAEGFLKRPFIPLRKCLSKSDKKFFVDDCECSQMFFYKLITLNWNFVCSLLDAHCLEGLRGQSILTPPSGKWVHLGDPGLEIWLLGAVCGQVRVAPAGPRAWASGQREPLGHQEGRSSISACSPGSGDVPESGGPSLPLLWGLKPERWPSEDCSGTRDPRGLRTRP